MEETYGRCAMGEEMLFEKTLAKDIVFSGRVFDTEVRQVQLPNGQTATREVVMHPGAVCIVAVTQEGEVLLERQWRTGYEGVTLEIPAGKLDTREEAPLDAAKRELREETGATAARWTDLGVYYGSPAILHEAIHMYLAEGLTFGETQPDEDEFILLERLPLERAVEMVLAGNIPDGKTQCGILRLAMMKRKSEEA